MLSDTGLAANRLELEITEGVFLSNDEHVHDMIDSLKQIGLKLALDDFGTGYSSPQLSAARSVRQDQVDQSFVRGACDPAEPQRRADPGDGRPRVRPSDADHRRRGRDARRAAAVRDLGCSLVQGYIFGKPMPAEEARELAAKGAATRPAQLPRARTAHRIIRAALLHHQGQVKGARLRNISSGGALIDPARNCRSAPRSSSTSPPAA